jgi:hypothetical protein
MGVFHGRVVGVAVRVGLPAVLVFMLVFDVLVFVRPVLVLMDNVGVTVFMTVLLAHNLFLAHRCGHHAVTCSEKGCPPPRGRKRIQPRSA